MNSTWTTNVDVSLRKPNAFHLRDSVTVKKSAATVFNFIGNDLSTYYADIARGHKFFRVVGSDKIAEGASIECEELNGLKGVIEKSLSPMADFEGVDTSMDKT